MTIDGRNKMNEAYRRSLDMIFKNIRRECDVGIRISKMYAVIGKRAGYEKDFKDGKYMVGIFEGMKDSSVDVMRLVIERLDRLELSEDDWQKIEKAYDEEIKNYENKEIQSNTYGKSETEERKVRKPRKRSKE